MAQSLRLLLVVFLFSTLSHASVYEGELKSQTGWLARLNYQTCRLEVIERTEQSLRLRVLLQGEASNSSKDVTLSSRPEGSGILDRVLYDYGFISREQPSDSKWTMQTYQNVRFSQKDSKLLYTYTEYLTDREFRGYQSQIECKGELQ